jgi:ubiquinone/menaquinone biosynthesis C-methylase UbiE
MDQRIENEISHGRFLAETGAGEIWNWESPAGKIRWRRRVGILTSLVQPGMEVLELGCGTGYFTRELIATGAMVTAIDISPELLDIARSSLNASNARFIIENAHNTGFDDGSFDLVLGSSVLHHLDAFPAVKEIYRVLKPGGKMIFTEPNMMNPQIAVQKNIPIVKKLLGDSRDETAFFRWKMKKLLKKTGFQNVNILPFDFLHPAIPTAAIPFFSKLGSICEKMPLLKEIAGSLIISADKPAPAPGRMSSS